MVRAGLDLPDAELALACASHSGEPFHREAAARILAGAGPDRGGPAEHPRLPDRRGRARRLDPRPAGPSRPSRRTARASTRPCSRPASSTGGTPPTYRDPEHPLQRAITDTLVELTGEPVVAVTVDGCGAPLHAYAAGRPGPRVRPDRHGAGRHAPRPASRRPSAPSRSTSAAPTATSPPRPRGRRAHRQGRRRVGVCRGAARRPRRRRQDRRRVPAGQGRRPRRRAAAPRRRRAGALDGPRARRRCSATASPSAPSSPSVSEGAEAYAGRPAAGDVRLGRRRRRGGRGHRPARPGRARRASPTTTAPTRSSGWPARSPTCGSCATSSRSSTPERRSSSSASSPSTATPARDDAPPGTPPRPVRWPNRSSRRWSRPCVRRVSRSKREPLGPTWRFPW